MHQTDVVRSREVKRGQSVGEDAGYEPALTNHGRLLQLLQLLDDRLHIDSRTTEHTASLILPTRTLISAISMPVSTSNLVSESTLVSKLFIMNVSKNAMGVSAVASGLGDLASASVDEQNVTNP